MLQFGHNNNGVIWEQGGPSKQAGPWFVSFLLSFIHLLTNLPVTHHHAHTSTANCQLVGPSGWNRDKDKDKDEDTSIEVKK